MVVLCVAKFSMCVCVWRSLGEGRVRRLGWRQVGKRNNIASDNYPPSASCDQNGPSAGAPTPPSGTVRPASSNIERQQSRKSAVG
jgi:hypothetical protein